MAQAVERIAERLLRIPLLFKILLANSAIVAVGAVVGTVLTVWHVQVYPNDFHYELILFFGLAGLAVSFIVNYAVLRLALQPLDRLQATVDRVRAGELTARVPPSRLDDERFARLNETFNLMLVAQVEAEQDLRRLSQRILEAQEEERQRVARELHDQSAQSLTMMLVRLHVLEKSDQPEQARLQVQELRKLTAQALEDIRRIALELRPKILEDLGLAEALAWQVDEMNASGVVKATLKTSVGDQRLPRDVELVLYRVGQEALTNVARHAKATKVDVALERTPAGVSLTVRDDGKGFDPAQALAEHRGLGLSGMRERLALVGGSIKVDSRPNQGACLCATVPVSA